MINDLHKLNPIKDFKFDSHKALWKLFSNYTKHRDSTMLIIKLTKLDEIASRYQKKYKQIKKNFLDIDISDKKIKLYDKKPLLDYLSDTNNIEKSLEETPLIELRMGELEAIYYFIKEYLSYSDIDMLSEQLRVLLSHKREYEKQLEEIKGIFFYIAFQSQLDHNQTEFMTQNPDIDLKHKEESIDVCNHHALYCLLSEPNLSFEALLKIAKNAKNYSFHLNMKLYKKIDNASKEDKSFLPLHIYIMPYLFEYAKSKKEAIAKSTLSLNEKNPHNLTKSDIKELFLLCNEMLIQAKKTPKNSLSLMMMNELISIDDE